MDIYFISDFTLVALVSSFIVELLNCIVSRGKILDKIINLLRIAFLYGIFGYSYFSDLFSDIYSFIFESNMSVICTDVMFALVVLVMFQLSVLPANLVKFIFVKGFFKEYIYDGELDLFMTLIFIIGCVSAFALLPEGLIISIICIFVFIPIIYDIASRRKFLGVQLIVPSVIFAIITAGLIVWSIDIIYSNKLSMAMGIFEDSYSASILGFILLSRPFVLAYDKFVESFSKIVFKLYPNNGIKHENIEPEVSISTDEIIIDNGVLEVIELRKQSALRRYEDYLEMKNNGGGFNYKISYHGSVYNYNDFEDAINNPISKLIASDKEIVNYLITVRISDDCDKIERLCEDVTSVIKDIVKNMDKDDVNLYIEHDKELKYGELYADIIFQLRDAEDVSNENLNNNLEK